MPAPTDRQVVDWLVALGPLVAARMTPEEAASRLRAYVPELVQRYEDRDFNQVSREFVARNVKFFPSYGELCELLDKWPKPSSRPALSAPEGSDLEQTDRDWMAFYHKRRAEIFAQQTGFHWKSRDADLANLVLIVRKMSPKAWREVSGERPAADQPPSPEALAAVARLVATIVPHRSDQTRGNGKPLPEVTLKGEELRQSRIARGCNVPVPGHEPSVPEPAENEFESDPYADSPA